MVQQCFFKCIYLFHFAYLQLIGFYAFSQAWLAHCELEYEHVSIDASYTQLNTHAGSFGWPCLVSFVTCCNVYTNMHPLHCLTVPHCTPRSVLSGEKKSQGGVQIIY